MSVLPASESMPERDAFSWDQMLDTGLLWLVNRVVLHPRGLALAFDYGHGEAQPRGWSLVAAEPGEPFTFGLPDGYEAERFQAIEALFAQTRRDGRAPLLTTERKTDA